MRWYLINKSNSNQPTKGNYNDPEWKEQIRVECQYQCIYCAIHESSFGGVRNYHVEHYKPKSLEIFKILIKDIKNLYYACGICNTFKGNDWPNDWPTESDDLIAYPDPSIFDYNDLFSMDNNFLLKSETVSGKYIINKLFLNRPQLINERRESQLWDRYEVAIAETSTALKRLLLLEDDVSLSIKPDIARYIEAIETLNELLKHKRRIGPYSTFEVLKGK